MFITYKALTIWGITPIIKEEILKNFEIDFYHKSDNSCPVIEFLDSLDIKIKAKFLRLLLLLEQNGNELREPYSKPLQEGIFELRIKQGTNIIRILYFFMVGHKIIITNGFIKKSLKTPRAEIELAKKYRKEYLERMNIV